jgi:phosphate transport system substrate-binding protein
MVSVCALLWAPVGCGKSDTARNLIRIGGSSTVFPITEAVAEEFQKTHEARIVIGVSGTGGGFEKFCNRELSITGASRPIKPVEVKRCEAAGVPWIELPVAYDGIAVAVHPDNDWVDELTVDELKTIWEPEAQEKITRWSQVREGFPDVPLRLFGAGVDSGTYDYFTKAIVGTEHASRGDYTSSEDDNILVTGLTRDSGGLAFFGFAYYAENADKVKIVPIVDDAGRAVTPTQQTIADGTYQPLSRPIFIYVQAEPPAGAEGLRELVRYWLTEGRPLVRSVGYVPLPDRAYELALARYAAGTEGSVFKGKGSTVGVTIEDLLNAEGTTP